MSLWKTPTFRARLFTSGGIVAVIITALLLGEVAASIFVLLITGLCAFEIENMASEDSGFFRRAIFVLASIAPMTVASFAIFEGSYRIDEEYFFMIAPLLLLYVFIIVVTRSDQLFQKTSALAISLLLFGCGGLFALTIIDKSPKLLLAVFILLWTNDTFAYLAGSKFGRTKLAPAISPGKTWEGMIGGIVACVIAAICISYWLPQVTMVNWIVIALLVTIFGTSGDLLQSLVKRRFGVKDSGSFLPGHGGFWDRFDSFYGAVPFIAIYLNLFA